MESCIGEYFCALERQLFSVIRLLVFGIFCFLIRLEPMARSQNLGGRRFSQSAVDNDNLLVVFFVLRIMLAFRGNRAIYRKHA